MLKLTLLCVFISFSLQAETSLLLIGGGKRPLEAMKEFTYLAGADKADILVIPWASETTDGADAIKIELATYTSGKIKIVPHELLREDLDRLLMDINKCSGIFFTGGNQNILMKLINDYQLRDLFRKKFEEGVVFAGTSAGTAIMSDPMLTGVSDLTVLDGSQTELTQGLGLLPPSVIVDQHFIVRSRFNRLAGLILDKKAQLGIGIDENTALLIKGKNARVIGPTQVLLFQKENESKIGITVISSGKGFSFLKR